MAKTKSKQTVKRKETIALYCVLCALVFTIFSCKNGQVGKVADDGDTLKYEYATLLTTVRHKHFTEVKIADPWKAGQVLQHYCLVDRDDSASVKQFPQGATVIYTPINRCVVATSPLCQLFVWLQAQSAISGVFDPMYIDIPSVKKLVDGKKIADCGSSMAPSIEKLLYAKPQAVFLSPYESSNFKRVEQTFPVVYCAEYMENTSLGRAEWMKFYGMLLGKERVADSLFDVVKSNYAKIKAQCATTKTRPKVITERKTSGTWFCPGGRSTMASMIADAHANYTFAGDDHSGSLSLAPEKVVATAHDADVWMFVYSGDKPLSRSFLLTEYHGYGEIKAFKQGNVYQCNNMTSSYFDEISFRPDWLLHDFMFIFHPETNTAGAKLRYYERDAN